MAYEAPEISSVIELNESMISCGLGSMVENPQWNEDEE